MIHPYDWDDTECSVDIMVDGKKIDIDPKRLASVRETVITMRHCWMIHDWLERKINLEINGDIYIPIDILKDLQNDINAVLEYHSKVSELISDEKHDGGYFEYLQEIHDELEEYDLTWNPYVSYVYSEWLVLWVLFQVILFIILSSNNANGGGDGGQQHLFRRT